MVLNNRPESVVTMFKDVKENMFTINEKGILSKEIVTIKKKANVNPRTEKKKSEIKFLLNVLKENWNDREMSQ